MKQEAEDKAVDLLVIDSVCEADHHTFSKWYLLYLHSFISPKPSPLNLRVIYTMEMV